MLQVASGVPINVHTDTNKIRYLLTIGCNLKPFQPTTTNEHVITSTHCDPSNGSTLG